LAANRLVLLAAVPLFLVLAVVAYITVLSPPMSAKRRLGPHTYQVMEVERRLQDDVQTRRDRPRGYLITRNPVFLAGYKSFVARVPADLKALRDLTQDNPNQQARADGCRR